GYSIHFTFMLIYKILRPGTFVNGIFYRTILVTLPNYMMITIILTDLMLLLSHILLFFIFETILKRTKYILSMSQIIITLLIVILYISRFIYSLQLYLIVAILIWDLFFYARYVFLSLTIYYFAKWSRVEFKAVTSFLYFGYILIDWGQTLSTYNYAEIPLYFNPIIVIIGTILFLTPLLINPKFFKNSLSVWKIMGFSIICFYILRLAVFTYLGIYTNLIGGIIEISTSILFICLMVINIKSEVSLSYNEKDSKRVSRKILSWKLIGISIITIYLIVFIYFVFTEIYANYYKIYYEAITMTTLVGLFIYLIIKNIKSRVNSSSSERIKEGIKD
ncbi:MAG: hypothetical protein ACFFDN_49890, partial [Candidatus Hodarchaeota archaeon]